MRIPYVPKLLARLNTLALVHGERRGGKSLLSYADDQ
jgi:hypothetical protein